MKRLIVLVVVVALFLMLYAHADAQKTDLERCQAQVQTAEPVENKVAQFLIDLGHAITHPPENLIELWADIWRLAGKWKRAFQDGLDSGTGGTAKAEIAPGPACSCVLAGQQQIDPASLQNQTTEDDPGGFHDPVAPPEVGSPFGATGSWARYHTGLDYRAKLGQAEYAVRPGRVVFAGSDSRPGYTWAGLHVAVQLPDGWTVMYSHMSRVAAVAGQQVTAGTVLGYAGETGRAFGVHLHFETYPPGIAYGDVYKAVDPAPVLARWKQGDRGRIAATAVTAIRKVTNADWDPEQLAIGQTALRVAKARGLGDSAMLAILEAGLVESEVHAARYAREGSGDLDSVGWLQQRRGWGSETQRADPAYAAGKFFDALVRVPGWESMSAGSAVQRVQRSAFPGRYDRREADARSLLAAVAGTVNAGPSQPREGEGNCTGVNFRAGNWNVYFANGDADVIAGARQLAAVTDVFGLEEAARYRTTVLQALPGRWAVSSGNGAGAYPENPIYYRTDAFNLIQQGTVAAHPAGTVDGGQHVNAKYIEWVELQNRGTGQVFIYANTHTVASVEAGGQPDAAYPRRLALFMRHLSVLAKTVQGWRARGLPVIVVGDWNAVPGNKALAATMGASGLRSNQSILGGQATHTDRAIDTQWSSGATPVYQTTLARSGSDHRPVVVVYGAQAAPTAVAVSAGQAGVRTVTDPSSGDTYRIPIPAGPTGIAMNFALDQLGEPYRFGAHGPNSWDCSGLVSKAYAAAKVDVFPQTGIMAAQEPRAVGAAQPGDLWGWGSGVGHVQMYLGVVGGKPLIIEAPRTGLDVRLIRPYREPAWKLRPTRTEV